MMQMNLPLPFKTLIAAITATTFNIAVAAPTLPVVVCTTTPTGWAACGAVGTVLHEAVGAANGKEPFNKNGEIRKFTGKVFKEGGKAAEELFSKGRLGGDGISGTIQKGLPHPRDFRYFDTI
jgi:hypothetical protein